MSRLIETGAWNDAHGGRPPDEPRSIELPYVLVADADVERAAICLEAVRPFKVGTLVARDGEEAGRLIDRFGPPMVLIVDLSLARKDGFALIEAVRSRDRMRTEIIAWSAFRELREFAAHRLAGLNVRVLGAASPKTVIAGAIERALQRRTLAGDAAKSAAPADIDQIVAQLAEKAWKVCRTPGVAVYMKVPGATQFRASVTWTSDAPIPHSPYYIPEVFGRILETGEALVLPDLSTQPIAGVPTATLEDVVRGLVAVPINGEEGDVVGTICVFDLQPLTLSVLEINALKALGRSVSFTRVDETDEAERTDDRTSDRHRPFADERAPDRVASYSLPPAPPPPHPAVEPPQIEWPQALLEWTTGEFAVGRELARARREQRPLSVVMFDVSIGEGRESDVLGAVADTLLKAIRQSDLPVRWTGGELSLVLPGLGAGEARMVAERVRAALHAGAGYRAAVSAGVVEVVADDTVSSVMMRAKEKVRQALERGRNRVA